MLRSDGIKRNTGAIILQILIVLAIAAVAVSALLVVWLSIAEYRPEERVMIAHDGTASKQMLEGGTYTVLTWNIGSGALGDNADFFLDGGKGVMTASLQREIVNLDTMELFMREKSPDVTFLQEVDFDSKRSHNLNQYEQLFDGLRQPVDLTGLYANDHKVPYVPYPIPSMIGKVDSGLVTMSQVPLTTSSERIQLPPGFGWPQRLGQPKRCLLVSRAPIVGVEKEVVFVNVHIDSRDNGEGKTAQTAALRDFLVSETEKGNYVIAGGDFSQVFSSFAGVYPPPEDNKLWRAGEINVADFPGSLSFYMDGRTPSCRSLDRPYAGADKDTFQYYLTDGFIVSSNLLDVQVETLDEGFVSSDHNPVILTFTLPRENTQ